MKKPKSDLDYVEFYAEKLKENPKFFIQHRSIINSQIKGSISLFEYLGKGEIFKKNARKYLEGIGKVQ